MLSEEDGIVIQQDFNDFRTSYTYGPYAISSSTPKGAMTFDMDGNVVALAVLSVVKDEGLEIEEFHLDQDGNVMFRCISSYSKDSGYKENEETVFGEKKREYYFLWPISGKIHEEN